MEHTFFDIRTLSDAELKQAFNGMSEERKTRCLALKNPQRQKQCIVADYLARKMISAHCNVSPCEVEIRKTEDGKPYLPNNNLYISISHSSNLVCCALSETPIGIDIERIRPISTETKNHICTPEEREYLNTTDSDRRFFELWTKKEALYKMGITLPLSRISALHPEEYGAEISMELLENYVISIALKK